MTKEQVIAQHKATALNAIRKLYDPINYQRGIGLRKNSWDESYAEQRNDIVQRIIEDLEKKLNELKSNKNGSVSSTKLP